MNGLLDDLIKVIFLEHIIRVFTSQTQIAQHHLHIRNFIESFQFPDHFLQIFLGQCCRLRQLVYEQTDVLEDPHPISMFLPIKYEMNCQHCCSKKKAEPGGIKHCFRLQVI